MDLNPTPFRAKFNSIFESLLVQLRKSPAATMPLLSLAKLSVDQSDDGKILTRIRAELNQPPENDKWFSISLVKCLHHLTPFDPNLGVNRIPILESVATSNYSEENRMQSLKMLGLIKFEAFLNFVQGKLMMTTFWRVKLYIIDGSTLYYTMVAIMSQNSYDRDRSRDWTLSTMPKCPIYILPSGTGHFTST